MQYMAERPSYQDPFPFSVSGNTIGIDYTPPAPYFTLTITFNSSGGSVHGGQ
jgi:hypothetical protein